MRLIFLFCLMAVISQCEGSICKSLLGAKSCSLLDNSKATMIPVEYLECDGKTWIDTGLYCSSYLSVEFKAWSYRRPGNYSYSLRYGLFGWNGATCITHDWIGFKGTKNRWVDYILPQTNTSYTVSVDFGNRVIKRNGRTVYDGSASPIEPYSTSERCYMLRGAFYNESGLVGRIYYFRIWEYGEMVRDYIPVKVIDSKGNVFGALLDAVSDTVFTSDGGSPFACGPEIAGEE